MKVRQCEALGFTAILAALSCAGWSLWALAYQGGDPSIGIHVLLGVVGMVIFLRMFLLCVDVSSAEREYASRNEMSARWRS